MLNPAPRSGLSLRNSARKAYMITRSYLMSIGEEVPLWEYADPDTIASVTDSATFLINNSQSNAEQLHDAWCRHRLSNGWEYGPQFDARIKRDPHLVSYSNLDLDRLICLDLFITAVLLDTGRL